MYNVEIHDTIIVSKGEVSIQETIIFSLMHVLVRRYFQSFQSFPMTKIESFWSFSGWELTVNLLGFLPLGCFLVDDELALVVGGDASSSSPRIQVQRHFIY